MHARRAFPRGLPTPTTCTISFPATLLSFPIFPPSALPPLVRAPFCERRPSQCPPCACLQSMSRQYRELTQKYGRRRPRALKRRDHLYTPPKVQIWLISATDTTARTVISQPALTRSPASFVLSGKGRAGHCPQSLVPSTYQYPQSSLQDAASNLRRT
ncbi:hypothetical protein B0H16DRAFT_1611461 [Mycena metata]|uniref:Uncharacterized protein n=1 Tax=Mycena metata TaxID=1033252 RepID=A0AAD7HC37_9AGAR|nr:hypothetical protein B0H16DRAFT_1611461 [Mycena metata]